MFILAHTGITLGVAWLFTRRRDEVTVGKPVEHKNALPAAARAQQAGWYGRKNHVDYRLVLIGSLLPDLIDKPLGLFAPGLGLGTGRGIAHTLVFALFLLAAGLCFYRHGRQGFFYLALASTGHLVLDRMWLMPRVLFWPLYGLAFPVVGKHGFLAQLLAWWSTLWTNPLIFWPEIIGTAVLLWFAARLRRNGAWGEFLKTGALRI